MVEATLAPNLNYKKYVASAAGKGIYPINSLDDAIAGAWATFSEAENDGSPQSEQ